MAKDKIIKDAEREKLRNTFLYAALLHDIGHAPFSHTCEHYFNLKIHQKGYKKIEFDLLEAVKGIEGITENGIKRFKKEFLDIPSMPSPHEVISATILIKNSRSFLGEDLKKVNLELAARMVIGCTYRYEDDDDELIGVKNCIEVIARQSSVEKDSYIESVFSYEALSKEGVEVNGKRYRLLSFVF